MKFRLLPVPKMLRNDVECIRVSEYEQTDGGNLAINVCLNGLPGIVFQHNNGASPIENIATSSAVVNGIPTLYVYGQMTQMGVMNYKRESFTTMQVILKPHALQTLLNINATALTNCLVDLAEFSARDLNMRMLEASSDQARVDLLTDFLCAKKAQRSKRDPLVEASLRLIHQNSTSITVKNLLDDLHISERQFEKRFSQSVGLSPQFYIRVKRFNEAVHLLRNQQFSRLVDVAHSLNYYDQSHFIRDIKAFSGITPTHLSEKMHDVSLEQKVYAYV